MIVGTIATFRPTLRHWDDTYRTLVSDGLELIDCGHLYCLVGQLKLHQSKPGGVRAREKYHSKYQGIIAYPKIQEVEVASETIESDHETPSHLFIDKNFEACLEQLDRSSPTQHTERQGHTS
jgi:hypothetical protein